MKDIKMSALGQVCQLFDFDDFELNEDNRDEFKHVATVWQDYIEQQPPYKTTDDRIYYHLFESIHDDRRICYASFVSSDQSFEDGEDPQNTHFYNKVVVPWLGGRSSNQDMMDLEVEQANDDASDSTSTKTETLLADKPCTSDQVIDEFVQQILSMQVESLVAPIAQKFMDDVKAETTHVNCQELLPYLLKAFKLGIVKASVFNENTDLKPSTGSENIDAEANSRVA